MLEARAIYRAGNLVKASDCDYGSARELGLICPFCDEPVFLVSAVTKQRQKSGKFYHVDAHFSHYPSGDVADNDCEKRSRSSEGQQWIENLRTERRNQRLKLFNRFFWDIVKEASGCPKGVEKIVEKRIGVTQLDKAVKSLQEWWNSHREEVYKLIDIGHEKLIEFSPESQERVQQVAQKYGVTRAIEVELDRTYFAFTVDQKLHKAIAYEGADFLGTRKAGIAFRKMVAAAIWADNHYNNLNYVTYQRAGMHLCMQLANTRWLEKLEQFEQQKDKGLGFGKRQ